MPRKITQQAIREQRQRAGVGHVRAIRQLRLRYIKEDIQTSRTDEEFRKCIVDLIELLEERS